MNKKRYLLLFHIPVLLIAIFVAWFFSSDDFPGRQSSYAALSTLVLSVWMLGSFYLFYSWLVPKFLTICNKGHLWLYANIFVFVLIPVVGIGLLLLTRTSALSLSEFFSSKGLIPYFGSVIITVVCSVLGALYRLLLNIFIRRREDRDSMTSTTAGL